MGANQSSSRQLNLAGPLEPSKSNKHYSQSSLRSTKSHLRSLRKGMSNLLSQGDTSPNSKSAGSSPDERRKSNRPSGEPVYLVTGARPPTQSEMMKCNIGQQQQQQFASLGRRTTQRSANRDCLATQTLLNGNSDEPQQRAQNQQMQSTLMSNNNCNYDASPSNNANGNSRAAPGRQTNCNSLASNDNNKQREQILFTSGQLRQPAAWLPQQAAAASAAAADANERQRERLASNGYHQLNESHHHNNQRPPTHHVATAKSPSRRRADGPAVVMGREQLANSSASANSFAAHQQLSLDLSPAPASHHLNDHQQPKQHHHHRSESWSQSAPLEQQLLLAPDYYSASVVSSNNNNNNHLEGPFERSFVEPEYELSQEALYYDDRQPADFDLEHYYSRNLRLLDPHEQPAQFTSAAFSQQQPQPQQVFAGNYPLPGQLSAPLQRRYKWPKQQYQYLNSQQQAPPADHFDGQLPLACAGETLKSHKRSKSRSIVNPLAALFQQPPPQQADETGGFGAYNFKQSHLTSSKSHQTLAAPQSSSKHRSQPPGGSLKRVKSSPLSAQQASYEAMRTIDMYLIRQIARNCRDFELEQKIDLEIRLRELAAQSMLEARNEIDLLEVEKSLLTSDQRMNCYAAQLEEQRKQLSNPSLSTDSGRGSKVGLNTGSSNQLRQHPSANSQSASNDSVDKNNTPTHHRTDVIGQQAPASITTTGTANTSSPSFNGSCSNSQSPSKLSPVSGESANSPPSFSSGRNSNQTSRSRVNLRTNHSSNNHSASNTLNRRHRMKHKRREQLMQKITSLSNINCNIVANNLASLSISELRIPLMWRDVDHFKQRGDYKRYAVFCLLKIDSQIYDTQLISDVDRQMTDLNFDDLIVFNDISHEFELTLEVYSCVYLEQFSLSSTPRKLKEKLSSSVSRAMGRRLATQTASASYTKELQAYDKSYRFAMIASAKLKLDDASDTVKTYDLVLVTPSAHNRHSTAGTTHNTSSYNLNNNYLSSANSNSQSTSTPSNQKDAHKNTLPLFGHFCCKLFVRPDVFDKNVKTGYLRVASIDLTNHGCNTLPASRRQSSDSPNGTSSNASTSGDSTANDSSATMLRSALAASSKLANLSMANSTVHWALLRNFVLHLWPIDEQKLELALIRGHAPQVDVSRKPPFSMMIDRYTKLLRVSNTSLTIETDRGCFVLAIYNLEASRHHRQMNESSMAAAAANQHDEISQWLRTIEQSVYDSHVWGSVLNHYPPKQQSPRGKRNLESNGISTRLSSG